VLLLHALRPSGQERQFDTSGLPHKRPEQQSPCPIPVHGCVKPTHCEADETSKEKYSKVNIREADLISSPFDEQTNGII